MLTSIVRNGLMFFSIPFFASTLGTSQYGIVSAYKTWVGIFTIVLSLQISGSIGPAITHYSIGEQKKYLSSTMIMSIFVSILFACIGWILVDVLSELLLMEQKPIGLMAMQAMGMSIITFSSTTFIFRKQAQYSFWVQILPEILGIVLSFYLVKYCFTSDTLYLACMYGTSIPIALLGIPLGVYFIHSGKWTFRWADVQFCLPICLPLIFHGLSGMLMSQSDRLMIQRMVGNADAGIYSFIILFSNALMAVWAALNNTWVPLYFDYLKRHRIDEIREKSRHYIFLFGLILSVFILWAPEVIKVMVSADYWSGIRLLPIFVLSSFFSFLYSFPANFQFYHMKTHFIAMATVMASCINIGLNYFVIPRWGMDGAAFATLVSHMAMFIFHEYVAVYVIDAPYHYNMRFFFLGMIHVCIMIGFFIICRDMVIVRWGVGMVLAMMFVCNIYRRKSFF